LLLGDSVDKALKLYAKRHDRIDLTTEDKPVSFRWGEEDGEVAITVSPNGQVSRIEVVAHE
jgi:hypothetical protein